MAQDPLSHVASWLTSATPVEPAEMTEAEEAVCDTVERIWRASTPRNICPCTDPVITLIAKEARLEALADAARGRGNEIFSTLPEDVRKGRVPVLFSDGELGRCLSHLSGGYFTSEERLERIVAPWRWLRRRVAEIHEKDPEAAAAEFEQEIGLDQALAQLRAGLEEIKAIREASGCEAHYREARDIERRASEVRNQTRNTRPVTLAGAIAMLEWTPDSDALTNAVIAGLRDLQLTGECCGQPTTR